MEEPNIVRSILEKENIHASEIKKTTSGFTNNVYFADDYVIKFSDKPDTVKKLKKEVSIYQNVKLDCMPKYITSNEISGYFYLIISKLEGQGLYSIWHTLNNYEKENCIKQIANILSCFNSINASFLANDYKIENWGNYVLSIFETNKKELEKIGIKTSDIQINMELFNRNNYGLVYNDAHFDNFIYNHGKLSLIDFDRVIYAPIDYEMLIFKTMCDNPSKFASEKDEKLIFKEDFEKVYFWFKKYYKTMFQIPNIEKRINIYQFNYLCKQAVNMKNKTIAFKWASELVKNYKKSTHKLMSTDSIPPTGLPLPFISSGGTSVAVFMAAIGICLNVRKQSGQG